MPGEVGTIPPLPLPTITSACQHPIKRGRCGFCDGCRRNDCVGKIAQWLRRRDRASVLSMSCFGDRNAHGLPDRAFDAVALESDLDSAITRLPLLERTACEVSKEVTREERSWFRGAQLRLLHRAGPDWIAWMDAVEVENGRGARPFERLLDHAAELIGDDLGPSWW